LNIDKAWSGILYLLIGSFFTSGNPFQALQSFFATAANKGDAIVTYLN
jgi:hypothetical protein